MALLLSLVAGACGVNGGAEVGPGPPATKAATASLLPEDALELPSFGFDDFERLMLQLRGTPVVVNIWASWCGPCRAEASLLVQAAERYGHDVQFLGVDHEDQRKAAADFMRRYHMPYPSLFDLAGEIHHRLGFIGLPDTLFYDADGGVAATWTGPLTAEALADNIAELLPK